MRNRTWIALSASLIFGAVATAARSHRFSFRSGNSSIPEANQGVGVDAKHFYAVDNQTIGKYDKKTGKLVKKWQGRRTGRSCTSTARW